MIDDITAYKKTYYQKNKERLLQYQKEYSRISNIRLRVNLGQECTNQELQDLYLYDKKRLEKKLKIKRYEGKIKIQTGFISVKFD